jgi:two-component system, chemotaxis family, sensor histidine kinase and response regulator PixL
MDTEQQIRLNFLDEAEEYFDRMESNLLGLANTALDPQQVDTVLRAAHSIKGGAAMMGFNILSQVAHRLEDFLKILRVRHACNLVSVEVETLLLQSVDCLRQISGLNRQGVEVTDFGISDRIQAIFEQLREHLGDLEDTDEDALMAQDEDIDPALLIFEEVVDTVLDRFETQLKELAIAELAQELTATAQELIAFGNMANLEPFIQLCQSIEQQAATISSQEVAPLAVRALKAWRRSHALVLRGSIEKLPSCLEDNNSVNQDSSITATIKPKILEVFEDDSIEADFEQLEDNPLEFSELQSAFDLDTADSDRQIKIDFDPLENNSLEISGLQSAFEVETSQETHSIIQLEAKETPPPSLSPQRTPSVEKMVRVPAAQLKQFNNLFEQLILDRNTINLRLQQFQNVISLISQRTSQMERSNNQLKQWYDRASIEGFLTNQEQPLQNSVSVLKSNGDLSEGEALQSKSLRERFDTLEMDRYSDVHLICQEQIETIVQLQEVTKDIELGLQELNQSVRDLNYTTKSMQSNVTRTQMLPFAEAVKRFPRVIRDLNLQFNKQVNLKIAGDNTLLDRSVIEALSDPLMHLLRNAFDHGIENPETRIAAGKTPSGTITIQASNQGTYTVITLSDDGSGVSLDKIRERIFQMGIPQSEVAKISEAELLDFIFEPGFSTAQQVTELSGRGVGMDVVRTNLQEIRGDVRLATAPGQGTTFTLRIPFTLSILRVAVIEQAGIIFAIPANSIRELIPLTSELITTSEDSKYIFWNQTKIPLVEIEKTLVDRRSHHTVNLTGNPVIDQTTALVVGNEKFFAALQISCFWNQQESTIRLIDSPIPLPPGVISSMVFGDGKVIPLVDPMLLIEECLKNKSSQNLTETKNLSATKTILVVDDSINVRRYLSLTLQKAGYRVEQAKDGREAVDKLIGGLSVQAVICDIEMPRLDGYGVLEEIKDQAEFEHLPIAMLTSRSNEKHRKIAMNLGASAYFSKPYNEQELLQKLAELLLSSHQAQARKLNT